MTAEVVIQAISAAATVSVAVFAFLFTRRSTRLQALLHYEQRWSEINTLLVQDDGLREIYASMSETAREFGADKERRFFLFFIGQALSAFHLRKAGAMSPKLYREQINMFGHVVADMIDKHQDLLSRSGYPSEFVRDLTQACRKGAKKSAQS